MNRRLALGVDAAELLRDDRGIGRYVTGLLREWHASCADRLAPTLLVRDLFPSLASDRVARRLGGSRLPLARRSLAASGGFDLLWYPWNGMSWTSPTRSVVTLHDVWPFASPAHRSDVRAREQHHYRIAAARAHRFIAVSSFTKSEACTHLGLDPGRVDVVPEGVEPLAAASPEPARIPGIERYVLCVGEADARKDVATLVAAMARLPALQCGGVALVIVGRGSGQGVAVPSGVHVHAEGRVADARLAALYAGAAAFAFPSRYEGFGLPILEAMLYGAPVVASDAASIPETGGDAALYFRAGDADALAHALARVLGDAALGARLAAAGRERAAAMTVARCAKLTLEVFERAVRD